MKYFLLVILLLPMMLPAQDNSKYLEGAVPMVDGKVLFSYTVSAPTLSQEQVYNAAMEWAKKRFITNDDQKGRVIYSNSEKGEIACSNEEYLVFTRKALSLDRSLMSCRVILLCTPGKCEAKITAIRYAYNVSSQQEPEKYMAEEQITDEHALSKNKDKLMFNTGKFRSATIDFADELFAELEKAVVPAGSKQIHPSETVTAIAASTSGSMASLNGFRQITPEQIPGNIIKMLTNDWMLITAGNEEKFNMMTASWGGLGNLYGKPVSFCFINPSRYTNQFMEGSETYTLTFYTEAYREALQFCGSHSGKDTDKVKASGLSPLTTPSGSKAFAEAWMIIECRKMIVQPIAADAIYNKEVKEKWADKPMHNMYIGEIINVWVK